MHSAGEQREQSLRSNRQLINQQAQRMSLQSMLVRQRLKIKKINRASMNFQSYTVYSIQNPPRDSLLGGCQNYELVI